MNSYRLRSVDGVLVGVVALLTLSTAYIHYWVGGLMLMLNSIGYVTLVVVLIATTLFFRRVLPLVLIAIAAYAAVTILGWLVMGPYFDVAYLAKGIEIVLIGTISLWVARNRTWTRDALAWARTLPDIALRIIRREPATTPPGTGSE